MKARIVTAIWFCAGVGVTLAVLELGLRALPVFGGVYAADPSNDWPSQHLVSNTDFTYSFGWNLTKVQYGHINNYGYVAPFDYVPRTFGIVVLGDSYVESLMTPYRDTLQGSLDEYLASPEPVLNFGVSGASLTDYIGVGPTVRQHFDPTWAVLVITAHDFVEGFERQPGYYYWAADERVPVRLQPRQPLDALSRIVRELALVRYARANLKLSLGNLVQYKTSTPSGCRPQGLSRADQALLESYLRTLPAAFGIPASRIILVFDSDRHAIYDGKSGELGAGCMSRDEAARLFVLEQAPVHGVHVVRTGSLFRQFHEATGLQVDYLPDDGHWNANGYRLVARRVAAIINAAANDTDEGSRNRVVDAGQVETVSGH